MAVIPENEIEDIEDQILSALRRIVRAIDIQSRQLAAKCGLTGPQLVTLRAIGRLGPAPLSTLAKEVSIGQATFTGIIDRLERRGFVQRTRSTEDRRKVTVTLTEEGSRILREAPPLLQDKFRTELERLKDWERTSMLATLQRVAQMMDAEEIEAAPVLLTEPAPESVPGTDPD